ncbi:MAG TPA: hypothetical protein VNB24_06885 [Acidimicrobiales bacterium]|nr:hypothetical protein [Acidimicrobiales bacterium]
MALAIVVAPAASSVQALPLPPLPTPVGPVVNAVDDVVDAVLDIILGDPAEIPGEVEELLTYQVHTVYPGAAGTIDKTTDAPLLVPTPINVDDDVTTGTGGNDVAVQLTIDAGRATLRVQTLPNAPSPLPLAVEGIMPDPRRSSDLKVAFGYDALTDTAPAVYDATIALVGASRLSSFALDVTTVSPGSTLAVTAGVFDQGPDGERVNPQHGRIDFTPVPTVTHLNVLTGSDLGLTQSGVDFVVNTPTTVDLLLEDVSGDDVTRATGRIAEVPETLSLLLTSNSSGTQNWTYRANARVGLVDLRVADTNGAVVNDDFSVRIEDLPLSMALLSDSPTHSTFTSDSAVGVIEAGFAHGGAVAELADPAYLYQTAEPGFDSLAFRVLGLSRAELSTADPTVIDVDMTAGPFHVLIQDGNRVIDGMIRDLPSSVRAELSTTGNQLSLVGNARIGEIVVDAHDPDGLAGRATDLDLRLVDLPESVTFSYGTEGGSAGVDAADGVIGSVDLLLTSGPVISVDDGFDGVILEDVADHFALVAKLNGLTEASVSTGEAPYDITLRKAAGPFLAEIVQGTRNTRIEFLDLPSSLQASFDPAGALMLSSSAPIAEINATLNDPNGVSGRATHASALLRDVPTTIDVAWDASGDAVGVDARGQRLGLLEFVLTSGPDIALPAGYDGVVLDDVADHYGVAVRMNGLRKALLSTGDAPYSIELDKDAGPFLVDLQDGSRETRIEVLDMPSSLDATLDPAGSISLVGSASIGEINTMIYDPAGVADRATRATAILRDVPTTLNVTWNAAGGQVGVDAQGQTVGLIDVLLTSGPTIAVPAGFDGVLLEDVADHYSVAVRLNQLKKAVVSTGASPYTLEIQKAPGPFSVRMLQGTRDTNIQVLDLPSSLTATVNPAGSLAYTSSATIGKLTASVVDTASAVSGRAKRVEATLVGLPTSLDVTWAGGNGGLSADAKGQTVGSIDFLMTSGPVETIAAGEDGVKVRDLADRYVVVGRLTGLKKVTFAQGPPPSFTLNTVGGRKFTAEIDTQKPAGIATIDAAITVLPATLSVQFTDPTTFAYRASAGVASVTLDAFDPAGISGRANRLKGVLTSLPTGLDVIAGTTGTIVADALGGTVGNVDFQLTSGPDDRVAAGFDGVLLNDLADRYVLHARMQNLKKVSGVVSSTPDITLNTAGGRPFKAELNRRNTATGKVEYTRATLLNLPATVNLKFVEGGSKQEITYTASSEATSLTLDTNAGDRWNLNASIANPLPASVKVCQASDSACGGSGRGSNAGSLRFDASNHTTVNLFDCTRPLNSTCVRNGAAAEYIRVDNLRARYMNFDANASGSGESGHIYLDTNNHELTGFAKIEDGSTGFEAQFNPGFRSEDRLGRWSLWGLSKTKTGSITCNGNLSIRVIGIWIGVTSYLC